MTQRRSRAEELAERRAERARDRDAWVLITRSPEVREFLVILRQGDRYWRSFRDRLGRDTSLEKAAEVFQEWEDLKAQANQFFHRLADRFPTLTLNQGF
ncbi:MAG TPA: hypothetical protein ENF32_04930 [Thermosulfidibacter takaii]|uniref:Uncharacterized protein n=1 Tax=Thermosulfidibacter takaii TaxID=412593 RepID=A0A7C0U7C7_9BACT|nr:hypothetical protein [Thermosulfidibacter takaii]